MSTIDKTTSIKVLGLFVYGCLCICTQNKFVSLEMDTYMYFIWGGGGEGV